MHQNKKVALSNAGMHLSSFMSNIYLSGWLCLDMYLKLMTECDKTQGKFDNDYQVLFPGFSLCHNKMDEAENALFANGEYPQEAMPAIFCIELSSYKEQCLFVETHEVSLNEEHEFTLIAERLQLRIQSINQRQHDQVMVIFATVAMQKPSAEFMESAIVNAPMFAQI